MIRKTKALLAILMVVGGILVATAAPAQAGPIDLASVPGISVTWVTQAGGPTPGVPLKVITIDTDKVKSGQPELSKSSGPSASLAWYQLAIYHSYANPPVWSGDEYDFNLYYYDFACVNIGGSWNDWANADYMNASGYLTLYQDAGCSGGPAVTTNTSTSPWKRCTGDGAYGPWGQGCFTGHFAKMPSSFYRHP